MTARPGDAEIAAVLMDLAHRRGTGASFCPSEAARVLAADWRPLMQDVRRVAAGLPLRASRKGVEIAPEAPGGPIRLSLRPGA
ncbi:DUF3253 domain-containing protein [Profundibacterium mesophilum]|uniref:DUF3253 domain-containing protein n=1 Tax=Profundibacterium mesophilum KAUST100406-0324 TaxID=1037889 RepID=A0A921NVV8_9RHOB|nr:DUF3253 domain-containing protein [Profundibacterium mesophilum]KAF0676608.1 hypothetical protein PMES_01340 [Profundibacterium mesophilum KAUST100406-0324]